MSIKKANEDRYLSLLQLEKEKIDFKILSLIPEPIARNHNIVAYKKNKDELIVKTVQILEATKMKRFRPVSRGTAHGYVKRMSHIRVVLSDDKKR